MLAKLALASMGGCAAESEPCGGTFEGGSYRGSYTELSGTCGRYDITSLHFSTNLAGHIMVLGDGREVHSEAAAHDCRLHVTQTAVREETVVERLDGEELVLEPDGSAHGRVELRRFDARGEVTCSSTYDARLTKFDG